MLKASRDQAGLSIALEAPADVAPLKPKTP
jgi:hypothetical protein